MSQSYDLGPYQEDLEKSQPLSRKEETLLAVRAKEGDRSARNRLVKANLRFVVRMALKYRANGVPLDDLINAGNLGLIYAAERFDEKRGCKFISYAVWWIRQASFDTLADAPNTVRFPANRTGDLKKIYEFSAEHEARMGYPPSEDEISEHLNIRKPRLRDLLASSTPIISLDKSYEDSETPRLERFVDADIVSPESHFFQQALRQDIYTVLSTLPEREAEVIRLYYGIGTEEHTLEKIGNVFKLSKERIRQIRNDALRKLRSSTCTDLLLPHTEA